MLQVDHVYEFLYQEIFKDFEFWHCLNGVINPSDVNISDISIFTPTMHVDRKIFFYDQEPFILKFAHQYLDIFTWDDGVSDETVLEMYRTNSLPYGIPSSPELLEHLEKNIAEIPFQEKIVVTSEYSNDVQESSKLYKFHNLYYFFHGFAALDWYRGYYALNYNKPIVTTYHYDFITFNRIINNDRSYRIYFISQLKAHNLLDKGLVSFGVTDDQFSDWRDEVVDPNTKLSARARSHAEEHLIDTNKLVIDHHSIHGSASASIPRTIDSITVDSNLDAFWHIVTETVFYYDKLHLTEKIFKPIVSKQPFMLLAAPGNLAYLKSYGFKTFDSVIDESYDLIQDNDARIEAVVTQLHWYCNLSPDEKSDIIRRLKPIIQYNFDHFYGEFKHIITQELLNNTKTLFNTLRYNDSHISYDNLYRMLTN